MGSSYLSINEARHLLLEKVVPIREIETKKLLEANNCVLAESVFSSIDVPLVTNSAMDGYAVEASRSIGKTIEVSNRIPAGVSPSVLKEGTAARIFTGAPLPIGADSVVVQEETSESNGYVAMPGEIKVGQNVRQAGEDIAAGEEMFSSGHRLRAQDLGLLASVGTPSVMVKRSLKIAVFSTGNELVEPGLRPINLGELYSSNQVTLLSLLKSWGMDVIDFGIIPDNPIEISKVLSEASDVADCVITTGGVSVGEEDHVKTQIKKLGELIFWKLNIKPGKPMALGMIGTTPILGLPGNPVSAFVVFLLMAKPFIYAMQGDNFKQLVYIPVNAKFDLKELSDRQQYLRVRISQCSIGLTAELYPNQGSGIFNSICKSDALAELPPNTSVTSGQLIKVLMFDSLIGP